MRSFAVAGKLGAVGVHAFLVSAESGAWDWSGSFSLEGDDALVTALDFNGDVGILGALDGDHVGLFALHTLVGVHAIEVSSGESEEGNKTEAEAETASEQG